MTNSEARQILIDCYAYWDGNRNCTPSAKDIGLAIDAAIVALGDNDMLQVYLLGYFDGKRSKSSIAQAIRDAALGNLCVYEFEWLICNSFEPFQDWAIDETQCRTFMLLVAEALA